MKVVILEETVLFTCDQTIESKDHQAVAEDATNNKEDHSYYQDEITKHLKDLNIVADTTEGIHLFIYNERAACEVCYLTNELKFLRDSS